MCVGVRPQDKMRMWLLGGKETAGMIKHMLPKDCDVKL